MRAIVFRRVGFINASIPLIPLLARDGVAGTLAFVFIRSHPGQTMRIFWFVSFLVYASFTCGAPQGHVLGTELKRLCNAPESTNAYGACLGYVVGIHDGFLLDSKAAVFCAPPEVTRLQLTDAVRAYMKDDERVVQRSANQLVVDALTATYPCAVPATN